MGLVSIPQAGTDMEITVHKGDKKEVYRCAPSDTLLSLKEKINENEGIQPSHQNLFHLGYWLNEPSVLLGDFLQDGDALILDLSRAKISIKLDSEIFGLVYHTDGSVQGERKYQVLRYNVANFAKVELKTIDGDVQVVLHGNILKPQDSTEYDERRSKTKLAVAKECSKIAADIGNFIHGITALIFPGTA